MHDAAADVLDASQYTVTTLAEAFQATVTAYSSEPALRTLEGTQELSWREYHDRVRGIASALAALGIGPDDQVAMMMTNRPEAYLVDTAAIHLRATPFCIYNTSSSEQIEYLLRHSAARVAIVEAQFLDRVRSVMASLPDLRHIFVVEGAPYGEVRTFADLESMANHTFDLYEAAQKVRPEDVAVLIYTSGTTGPPKGVELTHANLIAQFRSGDLMVPVAPRGNVISYLPMAHLADRAAAYLPSLMTGATITCVSDPSNAIAALRQVRPSIFAAVPRIWDKLHAALNADFTNDPDRARSDMMRRALAAATVRVQLEMDRASVPAAIEEICRESEPLFAAVREQLGLDRIELLFSGAAPIAAETLQFFAALGVQILESWSLSEASAAGTLNPPGAIRIGTVGVAMPGHEVTVTGDNELLIRGPGVMRGYRNDPARTAEAIDTAGWLHTGDLGVIDDDGYVTIVGRKKELIINAAGKNMSPNNIENAISCECTLIGAIVVIGDQRPYNTALIVLNVEAAQAFMAARDVSETSVEKLVADPRIQTEIRAAVSRGNKRLSRVEQIKRFTVLPCDWLPGSDELTPTMKLKRGSIAEKYSAAIDSMYET